MYTPWKACRVDGSPLSQQEMPPIRKAVFELVKRMVEWKVIDNWNEENG